MLSLENAWKILMLRLGIPETHWVADVSSLLHLSIIYFLSTMRTSGIGMRVWPVAPIVRFRFIMFRLARCMFWNICSIISGHTAFTLWYIPMAQIMPLQQQPLHWCRPHQSRPRPLTRSPHALKEFNLQHNSSKSNNHGAEPAPAGKNFWPISML